MVRWPAKLCDLSLTGTCYTNPPCVTTLLHLSDTRTEGPSFLFLLVEALAVEDMNFHNIKNKKLLISRMGKGLVDNVWHPLTLDSKWLAEHPSVVPAWDVLNISRTDFEGIVRAHDMRSRRGLSWESVIPEWRIESCTINRHGGISWVNFHDAAPTCPIDPFFKGLAGHHIAHSDFLFPSKRFPNGWVFDDAASKRPSVSAERAGAKKRSRGLNTTAECLTSEMDQCALSPNVQAYETHATLTPATNVNASSQTEVLMVPNFP